MDDRVEKRISILRELNINTNDAAIKLLHNILSHPHSKNLISSNYIEGIDNSIALYINQMCSDITENNQELWDILFTIKDYCFTGIGKGEMLLSFLFDEAWIVFGENVSDFSKKFSEKYANTAFKLDKENGVFTIPADMRDRIVKEVGIENVFNRESISTPEKEEEQSK